MAYHSKYNDEKNVVCGLAMSPIKTTFKGPAQVVMDQDVEDIIDEAIQLYRANILFKNYDISGPGDTFMIYMMVWITHIFSKIVNCQDVKSAQKAIDEVCGDPIPQPNAAGFFMKGLLKEAKNKQELDQFTGYLQQARKELAYRLVDKVYVDNQQGFEFKFWYGLSKNKFMNLKYSKW